MLIDNHIKILIIVDHHGYQEDREELVYVGHVSSSTTVRDWIACCVFVELKLKEREREKLLTLLFVGVEFSYMPLCVVVTTTAVVYNYNND